VALRNGPFHRPDGGTQFATFGFHPETREFVLRDVDGRITRTRVTDE
jgi:hypothetical protein